MSTEFHRADLAVRPTRVRSHPRIEWRRRLNALAELFLDVARKPDALYALTRRVPRCKLPDEKLRTMIHDGIRAGQISRARLIRYRAAQLQDDFAQFPDEASSQQVLYVQLMLEQAEAIEAQTVAYAMPTEGNRVAAVRETREAITIAELQCAMMLPSHPLPHGAHR